jgi:hypothetical protein
MALFMDIHKKIEGLTRKGLEEAHKKDLEVQGKHGARMLSYWYNEDEGKAFCLGEAPDRESFAAVHREAHGVEADEIIEVKEGR